MSEPFMKLLANSPYIFIIVIFFITITILWKENKTKDKKIYDLAKDVVKIASIYEERLDGVKTQNEIHGEQHNKILELLRDIKRILK